MSDAFFTLKISRNQGIFSYFRTKEWLNINQITTAIVEVLLLSIIFTTFVDSILKTTYMKELVSKIQEVYAALATDAALQIEKGNKAAGTRARKASLELEKLMKEFRKISLKESKK